MDRGLPGLQSIKGVKKKPNMTKHLMDGWKGLYILLSREKGGEKGFFSVGRTNKVSLGKTN